MRKKTLPTLLLAAVATLFAQAALAQVAKVNGVTIPQARADALLGEVTAQGRPDSPELREAIKKRLIESELISQEAVKLGLNKRTEVATQIELSRQQALVGAYFNDIARRNPVSEEAMKKAHERFKNSPAASEYKARHILVQTEAEAAALIAQINGGADFGKLATEKSRDEGSKGQGGELAWSPATNYVAPFRDALIKIKKGEMTAAPVQTQFGWHIIRLDDLRPLSFESLKPQLQRVVHQENAQKALEALRTKAKIE